MVRYLLFLLLFIISCEKKIIPNHSNEEGDKLYNEGTQLLQKNSLEAYSKLQEALHYYYKEKDSSNISKALICQSIAQQQLGDIFGAEATLVEALTFMNNNDESLYSVYATMGNLKYDQKAYSSSEEWHNKALAEKIPSKEQAVVESGILNNKAAAEYRQGKYNIALQSLQKIDLSKVKDVKMQGKIRENILYTQWLLNNTNLTHKKFKDLLAFKLKNNDIWGVNSSYSHLAEIYQKSNPDSSLYYAKQMLITAETLKSPEDRLEAIEKIALVDAPSNAIKNFKQYKTLSDSIQNYKNENRNRFAYIKYDSEKKEIENQRLKATNVENKIKLLQRNIGIGTLSLALIGGTLWFRRRKRLQQENELKIKENELKLSKKVHDVVANGIYQVMTKIENQEDFDKDRALDELEFVYEKSRDISYEKPDTDDIIEVEFAERIFDLIKSFENDSVRTYLTGNTMDIWNLIDDSTQEEIYQVIRELLVNMKKHSRASLVSFKMEKNNDLVKILYKDNGIGIPGNIIQGNGLKSTVSRIAKIKGTIIFDNTTEKGLEVHISFPVS